MIFFLLAPAYLLVNGFLYVRSLIWFSSLGAFFTTMWFYIPYTILFLLVSTSILTSFFLSPSRLQSIIKQISNYWLGALCYILLFALSAELFLFVLRHLPILPKSMVNSPVLFSSAGLSAFLLIAGFCLYGIYHARQIREISYDITLPKTCGNRKALSIALIADLHLGTGTGLSHVEHMVKQLKRLRPDLICIAGDIFDNNYDDIQKPDEIIRCLQQIHCPLGIYACYGNHDISEKILGGFTFRHAETKASDPRMDDFLKKAHIHLLRDETVCIQNSFYLCGRLDYSLPGNESGVRLTARQLLSSLDPSMPVIVLDHQPKELSQLMEQGADLVLSGHTHGGQMFPANVPVKLAWANAYGHLHMEGMHSVVTSGVGIWGPGMRVGTNSEIVMVHLHFSGKY